MFTAEELNYLRDLAATYDDGSYRAGDENYSDSPYYIGGGLFQNRGAGPESRNETVDIGSLSFFRAHKTRGMQRRF
jgi:hypothetical protein